MKLQLRLLLLFTGLLATFLGVLLLLHIAQARSADSLKAEIAREKVEQLGHVITVTGATFERFVSDYTQWDEMCTFAATADPEWGVINIDQSLESWRFHAAWVLNAERHEIYRRTCAPLAAADLSNFPSAAVLARICTTEQSRFFADSPQGLLEIRTAPIHPSDENRLGDPPQGWFVAARLWDAETLAQLGELTNSSLTILDQQPATDTVAAPSEILANLPLPGVDGQPIGWLHLRHESRLLGNMVDTDRDEAWLLTIFGVLFLAFAGWFVHRWIHRPLCLIEASLQTGQPDLTTPLEKNHDEFARVAQLVHTVAAQRQELSREVQDRTYAESELRHAISERAALGRDLNDGVIQSIYAIGMALQGVIPLVRSTPEEARHRIATCIDGLNRTISQLRAHIAGLEQTEADTPTLDEGLRKLIQEMNPARSVEFRLNLDPSLVAALQPDPIVQLIFIAREAISNALRHGQARRVTLSFLAENGEPVFSVADNGRGFDPALGTGRGHGLDNMTRRAEEIGATLSLDSAPAQGARVRVELPRACFAGRAAPSDSAAS